MENKRSSLITIGGEQYEMVLTTRMTKAIFTCYGGLYNLGDKLMKSENMGMVLDEIVWLMPFVFLPDLWKCHKELYKAEKISETRRVSQMTNVAVFPLFFLKKVNFLKIKFSFILITRYRIL